MPAPESVPAYPTTGANGFVYRYIESLPDLAGRTVVDIPCGDGRASYLFARKGATIIALDLFPEFMRAPGVTARHADMSAELPLPEACADYVICQEGIEHVPDQLRLLAEFNRVLKPDGRLLLTTPSLSHARARLSWLLFESDFPRRMPPNELDSVLVSEADSDRIYFGHLFLLGVHRLQSFCGIAGFRVVERLRTEAGVGSVILGLVLYPLLAVMTLFTYRAHARKRRGSSGPTHRDLWWSHVRLNLAPTTLFCKHIFWVLKKEMSGADKRQQLRGILADRYRSVLG